MNKSLNVEVTQEDCDLGCRGTEHFCVVATAIMRLEPEANRIEVNVNTIRYSLTEKGRTYRLAYQTPHIVKEYIRAFDAGAVATPMTFTLTNPEVVEKSPTPKGKAKTPSFKPTGAPKTRRAVRVFGEKTYVPT